MYEMQCMLQLGATRLLMGGHHGKMIDFNIDLCKEMQVVSAWLSFEFTHNLKNFSLM